MCFFFKALKISYFTGILCNSIILLPNFLPIESLVRYVLSPIIWWSPAIIDFNCFVLLTALVLYRLTNNKKYLFIIPFLFLIPVLNSIRTGLIGLTVALLAISFFKYKLRALPIFCLIIVSLISITLYTPNLRHKMFKGEFTNGNSIINNSGNINFENIETNGRNASWKWALDNFYNENEYVGSGIGNLQAVLYSGDHPFGRLKIIHNDYVQILCDTGKIGLILYLLIITSFVTHCFNIYNNKKNVLSARYAAFIAGSSLCGIMACAFTDNVINYSLITLSYPFVFYGFALSLKNVKK